jgi:hypothetical protein
MHPYGLCQRFFFEAVLTTPARTSAVGCIFKRLLLSKYDRVRTNLVYSLGLSSTLEGADRHRQRTPSPARAGAAGQGAHTRRHSCNGRLACDGTPSLGRRASSASWRHAPGVEALLRRRGVILGVQRPTTADTTAGAPSYSPRWDKDQGVRWTIQRGDGRAGKGVMSAEEARVSLRHHYARSCPCSC